VQYIPKTAGAVCYANYQIIYCEALRSAILANCFVSDTRSPLRSAPFQPIFNQLRYCAYTWMSEQDQGRWST